MRILYWSETFWPRVGGVETLAAQLLPALRSCGHEFSVVTWEHTESPDKICYKGIPVHRFPFFAQGEMSRHNLMMEHLQLVAKLKREFAPDIIHINSFGQSVFYHLCTQHACPAPMLVTLHQALPTATVEYESLLGKVLRSAKWVTCCSMAVLKETLALVPEMSPRISVIHNAIEGPAFAPRPMSFDPPLLLFVGRLVPEKGLDWALSALVNVFQRFPKARLIIAGDGHARDSLLQQTEKLKLLEFVTFVGRVEKEKVTELIDKATVVVIPSRSEGFGLVALEAALMARPVVATKVGGLPEVVQHGQTGLLIDLYDSNAFAEATAHLLSHKSAAIRMGGLARKQAIEKFGWASHVNAYDALYRHLSSD